MRKMRLLHLAAICIPAFAQPPACPTTVEGLIALGTGSCFVPGLGTLSNFRASFSGTNGGDLYYNTLGGESSVIYGPRQDAPAHAAATPRIPGKIQPVEHPRVARIPTRQLPSGA
jgi:hypothetical protein